MKENFLIWSWLRARNNSHFYLHWSIGSAVIINIGKDESRWVKQELKIEFEFVVLWNLQKKM